MSASKIKLNELREKIKSLSGLEDEEKARLLELLSEQKRYGLVWEDHAEDVEEELRTKLPVLTEVKERQIISDDPDAPNHILIEGDNLHALNALTYTHEGKIDVIYIDPPYNTGAKDWRYNNEYVDNNDSFRHSKWLSWISKRVSMAKRLLSRKGIIVVTIDDYEYANLKLLMDDIFSENNYLGTIVIRNNPSGRSTVRGLSVNHEYALLYSKTEDSSLGRMDHSETQKSRYSEKDDKGFFEWENFRKNGTDSDRKDRPKQFYPIVINTITGQLRIPSVNWNPTLRSYDLLEAISVHEEIIWPLQNRSIEKVWKYGIERAKEIIGEIKVKQVKDVFELYRKKYINDEGSLPRTWWDKPDYSARDNGTRMLTNIFGPVKVFDFPKATEAVKDCLIAANLKKNGLVLDFFAGSGTTLHATMLLNSEDGGHRTCILVTNNENKICEEVTYIRNKKVIEGYSMPNGLKIEGLKNNTLRYFKTDFVNRERTPKNMRQLMNLSTDLLCIKENLYKKEASFGSLPKNDKIYHYYDDGKKQMLVIFKEEYIDHFVKQIKEIEVKDPIKVYLFSPSRNAFTDEFIEVEDKVKCVALPAAIYDAYQRVLPKYKDPLLEEVKKDEVTSNADGGQLTIEF